MDVFKKCFEFTRAEEAKKSGLYPYFTEIEKVEGNYVWVKGKKILMVGSNNYLGLFDDPKIKERGDCRGRAIRHLHLRLPLPERHLFAPCRTGKEAGPIHGQGRGPDLFDRACRPTWAPFRPWPAATTSSSWIAWSTPRSWTRVRLSYAHIAKFKHNDMKDLEEKLAHQPDDKGKLIVVDGVFSMEGDLSNLPEIVKLAKKYNARVMVDDAHGVGVMGEKGRGTAEHFGLVDEVDLIMTTFSKSFASLGGFVAGDSKIIQYIKHHARALIFSASITPAALGAAHKALEIIQTEPWRRQRLWEITRIMNRELTAMGYHTGNTETPIIPVFINDLEKTFMLWKFLRDYGIFTNPVIAPAVPPEDSLIRTSFTATHTDNDLDFILEGFKQGGKPLGLI